MLREGPARTIGRSVSPSNRRPHPVTRSPGPRPGDGGVAVEAPSGRPRAARRLRHRCPSSRSWEVSRGSWRIARGCWSSRPTSCACRRGGCRVTVWTPLRSTAPVVPRAGSYRQGATRLPRDRSPARSARAGTGVRHAPTGGRVGRRRRPVTALPTSPSRFVGRTGRTLFNASLPRRSWTDADGLSAHVGLYRMTDLSEDLGRRHARSAGPSAGRVHGRPRGRVLDAAPLEDRVDERLALAGLCLPAAAGAARARHTDMHRHRS